MPDTAMHDTAVPDTAMHDTAMPDTAMHDTATTTTRHPHRRRSTVATAGLASLATLVLAGCGSGGTTDTTSTDTTSTGPQTQAPTALTLPGGSGPAAACAEPTPDTLAAADAAFAATVTVVDDQVVVMSVDTVYTGDPGATVTIPRPAAGLPGELSIGTPTEGETWLVSTQDAVVLTCGQSGPATPALQAIYDAAY